MHIVAFIVAVLAAVASGIEWYKTRSLLAASLCLFEIAFILVFTLEGGDAVTFG